MNAWGPHAESALNSILRSIPAPGPPACNKMAEAGAIVKKYQNQTVIPHVKEFFSGKENAGSPKMKILFFFFFFFFFFFSTVARDTQ
jgi:hypothetical protein